jgi:hypothetical protein
MASATMPAATVFTPVSMVARNSRISGLLSAKHSRKVRMPSAHKASGVVSHCRKLGMVIE